MPATTQLATIQEALGKADSEDISAGVKKRSDQAAANLEKQGKILQQALMAKFSEKALSTLKKVLESAAEDIKAAQAVKKELLGLANKARSIATGK